MAQADDIEVFRKNARDIEITVNDPQGQAIDVTGMDAVFSLKTNVTGSSALISLDTRVPGDAGKIECGGASHPTTVLVKLDAADTDLEPDWYVYDCLVIDQQGAPFTVIKGHLEVREPVRAGA